MTNGQVTIKFGIKTVFIARKSENFSYLNKGTNRQKSVKQKILKIASKFNDSIYREFCLKLQSFKLFVRISSVTTKAKSAPNRPSNMNNRYIYIFSCLFYNLRTQVELCIKIMSDVMELLFRKDVGPTFYDLTEIIQTDLRTIIQSHIKMERDNPHAVSII